MQKKITNNVTTNNATTNNVTTTPEVIDNDNRAQAWYIGGNSVIDVVTSNATSEQTFTEKKVETKTAGIVTMYTDKIKLAAPTKSTQSIIVHDKSLIDIISNVRTADKLTKLGSIIIAKEISKITEEQAAQCGFGGDIVAFAHALFDYSKTTISLYRSVANAFINDDYSLKDEVSEFRGIGYLIELLPILSVPNCDITTITDLLTSGTITENMSTSTLRKAVKDWKNSKVIPVDSNDSQDEEVTENSNDSQSEDTPKNSKEDTSDPELTAEKCLQVLTLYAGNNADIISHIKAIGNLLGIN